MYTGHNLEPDPISYNYACNCGTQCEGFLDYGYSSILDNIVIIIYIIVNNAMLVYSIHIYTTNIYTTNLNGTQWPMRYNLTAL